MKAFLFIVVCIGPLALPAQEVPPVTEQQLENRAEEAPDDDALLQQLAYYQAHPLNLNSATAEDLSLLRLLNELQIQSFLRYRYLFGALLSVYELQAVPGFDVLTIQKILPYIKVGDVVPIKDALLSRLKGGSSLALFWVSRVLEKATGYDTSRTTHYLGDRNHLQARFSYQYKNLLYYGLLADKDAGEQFFKGEQKKGFDFYSGHFFVRNLGKIKAFAIGDYTVNLGQGLIQWQSLAFGKGAEVINSKRQLPVLLPYRSAGEFYFNRGAAASVQWGSFEATGFLSWKKMSGNLTRDSVTRFSSFATSGLYRTRLEVEDRYKLSHLSTGGRLAYQRGSVKTAINAVFHQFSVPMQKRDEPYNRFALSGLTHFLASADYSYIYKNVHLFGELAADRQLHKAVVQGAMVSVDAKMDLSFLYRNISKGFSSPFGNAFTESTLPSNEQGFYTGIQLRPLSGWQVSAYSDFYQFPFIRYRISAPVRGWDHLVQVNYTPDKKNSIYFRYRTEYKPLNAIGRVINYPQGHLKRSLRLHYTAFLTQNIQLKTRTEISWFRKEDGEKEEGFLTYAEFSFLPLQTIKTNIRLQYFETGGYDSRIYAYESDVLYSISTPAFFDKGFRYYLTFSYAIDKKLSFWLRMAQTLYTNKTTVGSGLDEIRDNQKTEIKTQLIFRL